MNNFNNDENYVHIYRLVNTLILNIRHVFKGLNTLLRMKLFSTGLTDINARSRGCFNALEIAMQNISESIEKIYRIYFERIEMLCAYVDSEIMIRTHDSHFHPGKSKERLNFSSSNVYCELA